MLGIFGIAALVWRARFADGSCPLTPADRRAAPARELVADARRAAGCGRRARAQARPGAVVVVLRVPRLRMPGPGLLDRYVSRLYLRIVGLSFLALLGLFYISTFIDASDKLFKGSATSGMVDAAARLQDAAVRVFRHPDCRAAQRARRPSACCRAPAS